MKLEIFKSSYGYYNLRTIDSRPTEEMVNYLKESGYRWSRNNNAWYPATIEAKNKEKNRQFVNDFHKRFFAPATQEQKSFGQELFEREQRKQAYRDAHGLNQNKKNNESGMHELEEIIDNSLEYQANETVVKTLAEDIAKKIVDEKTAQLEALIAELREERRKDQEKIAKLEFELSNSRDEGLSYALDIQKEQQEIDEEAEWERENTLTEEEEQEIIESSKTAEKENPAEQISGETVIDGSQMMNKLADIMNDIAKQEEPEAERDFKKAQEKSEITDVEVSPEELSIAKAVLPTSQYVTTLRYSNGEEGNFFKQKIKDIAEVVKNAPKIYQTNGAEQHPIVLRYFHPTGTETLVTEIGKDGEAYGFQCLNGDYQMAEWGYIDLNEVKNIRMMEIDYHVEKGMTVERWLYKNHPEIYPEYAKFLEQDVYTVESSLISRTNYLKENKLLWTNPNSSYKKEQERAQTNHLNETPSAISGNSLDNLNLSQNNDSVNKKTPLDIAKETGNDVEAISEALKNENVVSVQEKPYNFFINDAANLDLGIGAEIEPITGLSAEKAAIRYGDMKDMGLNPYIGLNIPGDFIFDDKEGEGAAIFTETNGRPSFYIGDNFVKELKENNEHAQNVLAAYKELYEMTDKYVMNVEKPEFVFDKENELFANIPSNDKEYAENLADWIVQYAMNESTEMENRSVSYEDILENTETSEEWLNAHIDLINDALAAHNDNELLDYNPDENEGKEFNLYFCSNSDEMGENTLFKQNNEGRWIRKSEEELQQEKDERIKASENESKNIQKKMFILDKLHAAGIEVVMDKNIFEELLNTSNIVQKMESENISERYFRANEAEVEAFSKELDSFIADFDKPEKTINPLKLLDVGSISPVMKILGIADVPIGIDQSTISKALREEPIYPDDEQGHKLTIEELKSIPQSLADPVMVFRSDSPTRRKKDSYVFFTEHKDFKNRTVIIPVAVNKRYGRLVINKVTSIYGRKKEVRYVKENIQRGNLVYFDKKRSLEWERECKVQFLAQVLPNKGSIDTILSKDSLVKFLNSKTQNMVLDNKTYGFAYEEKIYLNPEIWNSEVAVHEYTHLWDNYIQRTNPELWEKGKQIFRNTRFWNEVKNDPNYADIADNNDLILSEVHARICGEMADKVLNKILEQEGKITADKVINWDNETWEYLLSDLGVIEFTITQTSNITHDEIRDFLSAPMKDLMNGVRITQGMNESLQIEQLTSKKDIKAIREQCREILKKPDSELTESEKSILAQYEGAGGLNEVKRTNAGILNEFYTPNNLVDKVWQIVDAYAPNAKTVLEPSAGVGKFANNRPGNVFTMHELDETSARINKILHPEANVIQGAYQKQFFDAGERLKLIDYQQPKYDVVIGNPPYGKYNDKYKGLGEGKEFDRYEEYFIAKGLEALKDDNSLLAFVVPSGFLNTASDKQKEIITRKGKLIDAYRLPVGTFPTTDVGTDIIVMRNWNRDETIIRQAGGNEAYQQKQLDALKEENLFLLSNNQFFTRNPEKILGEIKTRTNRFGKEEDFVVVHEGLTVQDELNKIDSMLPSVSTDRHVSVENATEVMRRDTILTNEMLNKLKNAYAVEQYNSQNVYNPDVYGKDLDVFERDFDNIVLKEGMTIDEAVNQIIKFETYGQPVVDINAARKNAEKYFELAGYSIESDFDFRQRKSNKIDFNFSKEIKENVDELNQKLEQQNNKQGEIIATFHAGITPALSEVYPDDPDTVHEETLKFSEAIKTMDFNKLGGFMLWTSKKEEPLKIAARKVFEAKIGELFPNFDNIDSYEANHLTELWLAQRTNVAHKDTYNKKYFFSSEQDIVEYIAFYGSGTQNGKERINEFFEKNKDDNARKKFLQEEYGWFGMAGGCFDMQCNNSSSGIKTKAYITDPKTKDVRKVEKTVSWKELCDEIKRQRLLDIYLDKPVEKSAQDQQPLTPADTEQVTKTKSVRPKKEKWNITKSKGEVMTAEEFAHLYGRDFDEREFPIWAATDWQGIIDLEKLSTSDIQYMHESGNYVQKNVGEWTHKVLFTTGDIYAKIEEQKELRIKEIARNGENSEMAKDFAKNIELLESSKKASLDIEHIHFGLKSTLAEEFTIPMYDGENMVDVNLQEAFILWAKNETLANTSTWRGGIEYATANITREELGEGINFNDIVDYIDGKPVKAQAVRGWRTYDMSEEEKKAEKSERKKEADLKRQARADVANKLFDRYIHEGLELETIKRLEAEYNRRFNSYIIPDYSKLPLFVDGMSAYKGDSKFKLYDQQIKGISFLCNKGNGLLAYDVGVGKTAAGIVATKNQIQTERSQRPLILVPNQVYSKWYTDIKQLFPNVQVNDLYNLNKDSVGKYVDSENPHKLNIPVNSISLCTYEALKNITFTDESCENELYQDFANLLSADMDGSERENAQDSDKIKGIIGAASHVNDASYYFFEDCGFDHITVDEAHNFKNLWVVPRPKKKGESNEYSGIPSGKPSARALKLYGMTQLVQRHNDNRNVFLLTATPFTNSPTEVYSMLSYIGRERLQRAGITSLRSFFDQFAQTKQELGVTSRGEIDTKQVMKNWKELPALQNILTEFIDKVDGEEIKSLVRPKKFTHVKPLDMSELQQLMRKMDEERMAEIKEGNSAAIIVAMNNMRLSCVAPALANPDMYEGLELPPLNQLVETSPKLKFVCDAIIDMYKENPEKGQFMYVPLGKESHGIIKDYLVQHGIPKEAVEIINGEVNNTPEKKEKITAKFNNEKDKCKIIIGGRNTAEGIDLNGNSFVMYNCSLGWNPSETIQAEGRIWRQGNLQGHVHIVYPVMNDSIDSVLYQKHDEKRSRVNELWNYKGDSLNVEDINPEDLKLDLIKDPQKKAKLILEEETKETKAELSRIKLKIKDFDDIVERRKQLTLDFGDAKDSVKYYEEQIEDYKSRELEVPEWIKTGLKRAKKSAEKSEYQKETLNNKLYSWNIQTPEDEEAYIRNLNTQKERCEEKIKNITAQLPEILQKLEIERLEQKVMEYPVTKQREILEADILNNLRPMKEVKYEILTERHNKMLEEKLKAGDITQKEHDLYKKAGYENYEKWLNGEIESLIPEEAKKQEVTQEKVQQKVETPKVENPPVEKPETKAAIKEAVEAIPSQLKNAQQQELFDFDDWFSNPPEKDDDLVVKSPEQPYFNFANDDIHLTPDQLTKAELKRDEIVLPILNGKESGMYKAFNDFVKRGVFDVVGTKIELAELPDGRKTITEAGFQQLHAAMNIYRDKQFETMRYVFINKETGKIRDQLAITSCMPNLSPLSMNQANQAETFQKLIARAELTDSMIVAVHNHPSGNITASEDDIKATHELDKILRTESGKKLFAGHIILDHNSFNVYDPHQAEVIGDERGWATYLDSNYRYGAKDEMLNNDFAFKDISVHSSYDLPALASMINDTNNWNDNFIPVCFANADQKITGVKLYDQSFFNKEADVIRNEFQFAGIEAGAILAFPVFTEAYRAKLNGADRMLLDEKLKNLIKSNAFTDAVVPVDMDTGIAGTISQICNINPGQPFFTQADMYMRKPEVHSTWQTKVHPSLIEQARMGTLKVIQDDEEQKFQPQPHLRKAVGMGY